MDRPRAPDLCGVTTRLGKDHPPAHGLQHAHLEAAAPAFAARRVTRVREELELGEDEARHDERAADEARAHDVRDATVDDDRGIEERARAGPAILAATSQFTDGALKVGAL